MRETLLPVGTSYAEVYARFRWPIPTNFNIGVDVCDRHADDPSRLAMIYEDDTGPIASSCSLGKGDRCRSASRRGG